MKPQKLKHIQQERRQRRARRNILGTTERPRLSVSRSLKHISAQLINDETGRTLASASTLNKALRESMKYGGNRKAAELVGQAIAERARMQGIKKVAFDRGGRKFHGRIKALAEAARKTGLEF